MLDGDTHVQKTQSIERHSLSCFMRLPDHNKFAVDASMIEIAAHARPCAEIFKQPSPSLSLTGEEANKPTILPRRWFVSICSIGNIDNHKQ